MTLPFHALSPSASRYVHPDYLVEAAHENLPPAAAVVDLMSIADERGMVKTADRLKPLFAAWGNDPAEVLPYPVMDPWWRATAAAEVLRAFGATGASPESVTFADGTYEMWKDLCGMVFRKGTLLGAGPIYPEFAAWWEAAGGRFRPILDDALGFPFEEIERALATDPSITVVYADTPYNATGGYPDRERFLAMVAHARERGVAVVADEAYANFLGPTVTLVPEVASHPNLVVLRSLSKAYDLRGLRFAFAVSGSWISPTLNQIRTPYAPSQTAMRCGMEIVSHGLDLVLPLRAAIRVAKAEVVALLLARGFVVRPTHPDAPNVMFGKPGVRLADDFAARGIRVARGSQFSPTCGDRVSDDVRIRVPLSRTRLDAFRARLDA